ncbi:hypothetical protein BDZ85DRAFT_77714 [Elsinoe ampelina]|uniref:Uncharacterized protein n=1 Tax=Elsinoe ampelina TaxID=302913 RepID=A0A6A6FZ78_9PEZI|nr:hypothetical protein BDZ85DRAFT_77714 [Elsinoe ampelina]
MAKGRGRDNGSKEAGGVSSHRHGNPYKRRKIGGTTELPEEAEAQPAVASTSESPASRHYRLDVEKEPAEEQSQTALTGAEAAEDVKKTPRIHVLQTKALRALHAEGIEHVCSPLMDD